jgi:hypothetical protein
MFSGSRLEANLLKNLKPVCGSRTLLLDYETYREVWRHSMILMSIKRAGEKLSWKITQGLETTNKN